MRQMPAVSGRAGVARGEAACDAASDEACGPLLEHQGTGSAKQVVGTGSLLQAALTRQNLQTAWKRVKANQGAAGVDGLDIEQTAQAIRQNWPQIRQALLAGCYRPSPVRKVMIPKPDGGQRELGIPTVTDRLIQQALLQVLQPPDRPQLQRAQPRVSPRQTSTRRGQGRAGVRPIGQARGGGRRPGPIL